MGITGRKYRVKHRNFKKKGLNNLQDNEIFMYFGHNFEKETKHEKNDHLSYNGIGSDFICK